MNLSETFVEPFSSISDPRQENHNKRHKLMDILVLAILAVICGADSWVAVADFGQSKHEWLKTFLELPNGIPSHDIIGDLFQRLDPKQLQDGFISWINTLVQSCSGEIVAIDGKTLRRSYDTGGARGAIHMVSAWAVQNTIVLGQIKTSEKSNEITAIPELLKMLDIVGATITIDAMGCQKKIAAEISNKGADYVLALKGNQGQLHDDVCLYLDNAIEKDFRDIAHDFIETVDKGHGRIERRQYWVTDNIDWLDGKELWKGLKSIGVVQSERHMGDKVSVERRYYIASTGAKAQHFSDAVRGHWNIENNLHWSLDISFNEDQCRVRKGHAAENFAILRHIALTLLKREKSSKIGIANKRLKAGWDHKFLAKVIACGQT